MCDSQNSLSWNSAPPFPDWGGWYGSVKSQCFQASRSNRILLCNSVIVAQQNPVRTTAAHCAESTHRRIPIHRWIPIHRQIPIWWSPVNKTTWTPPLKTVEVVVDLRTSEASQMEDCLISSLTLKSPWNLRVLTESQWRFTSTSPSSAPEQNTTRCNPEHYGTTTLNQSNTDRTRTRELSRNRRTDTKHMRNTWEQEKSHTGGKLHRKWQLLLTFINYEAMEMNFRYI